MKKREDIPQNLPDIMKKMLRRDRSARERVDAMVRDIMQQYPEASTQQVLENVILPGFVNSPKWALEDSIKIGQGTIFNSGAFCVYWGLDPDTNEYVALVQKRKETDIEKKHLLGAVGGYTKRPEQDDIALVREFKEEMVDDKGKPVMVPDRKRFALMNAGKDFQVKGDKIPVQYIAYTYDLSGDEIRTLKAYAEKFKDRRFKVLVAKHTSNENHGIEMMPLREIVELPPEAFRYGRQNDIYHAVARKLGIGGKEPQKRSSSMGHTMEDMVDLKTHLGSALPETELPQVVIPKSGNGEPARGKS